MKILSFGDQHFYGFHRFSKPSRNGLSTRLHEHLDSCRWIASVIRERKPDMVKNGGDIIHTLGQITTDVLFAAAEGMNIINEACIEVGASYVIDVGNHDLMSENSEDVYATRFLKYYPNITLIDKPTLADGILHIPYTSDPRKLTAALLQNSSSIKLVDSHLDIAGARFHATRKDEHGTKTELFERFPIVINHHYHLPQIMQTQNYKIIMPGSPQEWSFHEPKGDIEKGMVLLDTDTGEYELIPNLVSPKFRVLINPSEEDILATKNNDYLLLKFMMDSDFERVRELLNDTRAGRYETEIEVRRNFDNYDQMEYTEQDNTSPPEELIREYVSQAPHQSIDSDQIIQAGVDLVKNK